MDSLTRRRYGLARIFLPQVMCNRIAGGQNSSVCLQSVCRYVQRSS
uniref:Uncharacterized protein n=1 Tax=Utricularia reniformis TaxID=192314 RepID=A0A1Y0B213_9LAMI|nr:hypothetical protein AEK19_MT1277 [Utricularia reniformis]ART31482.1 hypothetical protein AEK19_MT1277 [Utricularia reniformis]